MPVVIIVVAISVALTVFGMVVMLENGVQMVRARKLLERQVVLTEEAMEIVDSTVSAVRCFAGDCP